MTSIVLTKTQLADIERQLQGGEPPVDPGAPVSAPTIVVPPTPPGADVTYTFESQFQLPWLTHGKGYHAILDDLDNNSTWKVRIFRKNDFVVFGETKWGTQSRLRLGQLGAEKARWNRPAYADITAKLNALQNVADNDLMWFPERIRYEAVYDQPWDVGEYIFEVVDGRGQVLNIEFEQLASPYPAGVTWYSAQAGPVRRVYCGYNVV
jgi:hypothetical protein